jgi:hypothetical protein
MQLLHLGDLTLIIPNYLANCLLVIAINDVLLHVVTDLLCVRTKTKSTQSLLELGEAWVDAQYYGCTRIASQRGAQYLGQG